MKQTLLKQAPIKDAIFEVLLDFPKKVDTAFLESFENFIREKFPNPSPIVQLTGSLTAGDSTISKEFIGRSYFSTDKNSSIQIRKNGFAFLISNQTYKNWQDFKDQAFYYFLQFYDYTNPEKITRYSLRYVNQIKIKSDEIVKDFVKVFPSMGDYDYPVTDLFLRMELANKDLNAIGIITEIIQPPNQNEINIFFDIDVIRNIAEIKIEDLDSGFDELRVFKNQLFFDSLTDKAETLFQ
jgi:uncharacterized protein (TIGR04255 family)